MHIYVKDLLQCYSTLCITSAQNENYVYIGLQCQVINGHFMLSVMIKRSLNEKFVQI